MKGKLESSCVLSCTRAGWARVTGEERLTLGPQCPSLRVHGSPGHVCWETCSWALRVTHTLAAHSADVPLTPTTVTLWPQQRGWPGKPLGTNCSLGNDRYQRFLGVHPPVPEGSVLGGCPEMKWEP